MRLGRHRRITYTLQGPQGSPRQSPTLSRDIGLDKPTSDERGDLTPSLLEELLPYILAYLARQSYTRRTTNESASTDFSSRTYGSDIGRDKRDEEKTNIPVQTYADGEIRTGCYSRLCWSLRILWIGPKRKENPGPSYHDNSVHIQHAQL
ncbi:hypothetical protein MSAN_00850300 [Mycena sanguinolenta]|uniref:Uncharacterized protein n=1 Tax=Mycena sanguinolenta TaxID=230812 RepID=A0A8H7DD96_9AGAR|nr:hypothetical protein MSAN_00850300 [Mycena sanguinolenta]